ncbi:hypothetical protein Hanom_Chr12g01169771 [Helianthus anomalus]
MAEEESIQVEEGPLSVLKWDQRLFKQIMRGFQFPPEWDARYPRQGQTVVDAPPGYITLFADFFLEGNIRVTSTNFMASILHFYCFHISQMSPAGMVRVRHFEFLCRSQGIEPTVEKFRAFYQLIRNIGIYSFGNRGAAKKIVVSPPKSFHDWKMKFFSIREEVIPIAMIFRESDKIEKEELPIPKWADWYMNLPATPNRVFGEQVLVLVTLSDKWPEHSEEVLVRKFNGEEAQLYQAAFPTFGGSMGVRPLQAREAYWYEQIKGHFLYPPAGKGGSSRAPATTHDKGTLRFRQSNLEDYVVASDSLEGLSRIGEKKKSSAAASKSSDGAGSRALESGATPSSIPVDEEEEHEEEAIKLVTRKRSREETADGAGPTQQTLAPGKVKDIGLEKRKEPAAKKPKFVIKPPNTSEKEVEKTIEEHAGDVILEKEKVKETKTAATTKQDKA